MLVSGTVPAFWSIYTAVVDEALEGLAVIRGVPYGAPSGH